MVETINESSVYAGCRRVPRAEHDAAMSACVLTSFLLDGAIYTLQPHNLHFYTRLLLRAILLPPFSVATAALTFARVEVPPKRRDQDDHAQGFDPGRGGKYLMQESAQSQQPLLSHCGKEVRF